MAKKEIKSEKKSLFVPLHTQSVGKSYFMKQVVYGLEKHGYSVQKYDGNPEHGDFIKSFGDAQELPFKKTEFFDIFKNNTKDAISFDLPVDYIDTLFEVTNESILDGNTEDHNRFLRTTFRSKYNIFFIVPFGVNVDKTEATLESIDAKTRNYTPKDGEKINLLLIRNTGLWKANGKKTEIMNKEYDELVSLNNLKQNSLFNVIDFTATENFASIAKQMKEETIDSITKNSSVQSNLAWEDIAFEIQEEAERLYQAYSPFL